MAAARVLVAVIARSIARVEDQVTVPQLRVLVMLATQGPLTMIAVASALGVHSSNATRAVDRLVAAGLVDRRDSPTDRRRVRLTLTETGQALVDSVFDDRRAAIARIVDRMPETKRRALPGALESFAEAAGEVPEQHVDDVQWDALGLVGGR
ncbi:MAG TPA: MarR family transcriptional regulator [Mycobacteriales bacterium]|nr:MarR family transcriptional regulator [Mycobacteriales bacterium]